MEFVFCIFFKLHEAFLGGENENNICNENYKYIWDEDYKIFKTLVIFLSHFPLQSSSSTIALNCMNIFFYKKEQNLYLTAGKLSMLSTLALK